MRRSTLVDGLLLTAVLVSTISVFALLRGIPEACPSVNPAIIEAPPAPCLASDRADFRLSDRPAEIPAADQSEPVVTDSGREPARDVESTGSIPQSRR